MNIIISNSILQSFPNNITFLKGIYKLQFSIYPLSQK